MREIHPEEDKTIWIIRFSDGTLASCYSTREGAEQIAARKAVEEGTTYEIH